jgi:hypothetical protein
VHAAMAVSRWIEDQTAWPVKKFVRTARRYWTIEIQVGAHTITAADPCLTTSTQPSTAPPPRRCSNLSQLGPANDSLWKLRVGPVNQLQC